MDLESPACLTITRVFSCRWVLPTRLMLWYTTTIPSLVSTLVDESGGCSRYVYMHACMQILLPLGGHAHLAEPGCLCTKQALGACASKLLENRLGTCRRTSYLLTASGVGTRSPTWTTAVEWKGAVICTPAYARYPFTAGWTGGGGGRQGKKNGQCSCASGGTWTHDPWIMSSRPKPLHHQAPLTYSQISIIHIPLGLHPHFCLIRTACVKIQTKGCSVFLLFLVLLDGVMSIKHKRVVRTI